MSMRLTQIKLRQMSYNNAYTLVSAMHQYSNNQNKETEDELRFFAKWSEGLPLPSGRWGNAIALALEVNDYNSADYLIKNNVLLGLEIKRVSSELGWENPWNLQEETLYSHLTCDDLETLKHYLGNDEENEQYISDIRERHSAFMTSCDIVEAMRNYNMYLTDETREELLKQVKNSKGLPLPSGRWGNAIALALETNDYSSAELLFENRTELNLETERVVSEHGWKNPWNLHDEYLYSQILYEYDEQQEISKAYFANDEDFKQYKLSRKENDLAKERLAQKLEVTEDEKKEYFQQKKG